MAQLDAVGAGLSTPSDEWTQSPMPAKVDFSSRQLTPFSERGNAVLLENVATVAVTLLVAVVVDRGMGSGNLLLEQMPDVPILNGDKGYDSDAIRRQVEGRGAMPNIPPMPQRRFKPEFSKHLHKARNLIERFFNKLKHFRAIATRYDKHLENYLAVVKLAAIRIWMRFNKSVT